MIFAAANIDYLFMWKTGTPEYNLLLSEKINLESRRFKTPSLSFNLLIVTSDKFLGKNAN